MSDAIDAISLVVVVVEERVGFFFLNLSFRLAGTWISLECLHYLHLRAVCGGARLPVCELPRVRS